MKSILVLVLFVLTTSVYSQDVELFNVTPDWKLGDIKNVHTNDRTITYLKDTVYSEAKIDADYKIEIVDTVNYFTILYTQKPGDANIGFSNEVINDFVTKLMKTVEEELIGFDYKIKVDKETGAALELVNSDQMFKIMKSIMLDLIDQMGKEQGRSKSEIKEMKKKIDENLKTMTDPMVETILNGVTYLFQAYTFSFPINETFSQPVDVYSINAMGVFGDLEFPTTQILESKLVGDELNIKTSSIYDKTFLLEQMKKKSSGLDDLTEDDVLINEMEDVTINMADGNWIEKHVSNVEFRIPDVYVTQKTVVTFR